MIASARALAGYARSHPIGARDPWGTLRRFVAWQLRSRLLTGPHDMAWVNGARLDVERSMHGATANLYFGLHEFAEMGFFAHFLRKDDVFVDIGTNVGSYTVLAAVVSEAYVHAFEPAHETLPKLRRNIALNRIDRQVTLHEVALGDREGTVSFTSGQDAMNRVAQAGDVAVQTVPLRRLDAELAGISPIAMKIDVEGAEPQVLAGAVRVLADPTLLAVEIETVTDEVTAALVGNGFVRLWYDPIARDLRDTPIGYPEHNQLFVRDADAVRTRLAGGPDIHFAGTVLC